MNKVELKSNTEWKQWGREDPLWAVSTWKNKHKDSDSPWTEEEFYALGESDFLDFWRHWRNYGVNLDSCLEIGCGAGRLTRPLATTFKQVYAVDVSEDMIDLARKAVGSNVQFSVIDGLHLPYADGSTMGIFSALVLQHVDSVEIGFAYFREFFRVLDAGGTLMIQLPVYQFPFHSKRIRDLMETVHAVVRHLGGIRADMKRRAGIKLMRMTPYSIESLSDHLSEIGFKNLEFSLFSTRSSGDLYTFVFASK